MPPRRSYRRGNEDDGEANTVAGPTSALTSFLRQTGITAPRLVRSRRENEALQQEEGQGDTTQIASTTMENDESETLLGESSTGAESSSATPKKKRKITKKVPPPDYDDGTGASNVAGPSGVSRGPASGRGTSDRGTPGSGPATPGTGFSTPTTGRATPATGRSTPGPTPGSFATCAECGRKFTVTKYTLSNPHGPGLLCATCATQMGGAPKAATPKPRPPRKRAAPVQAQPVRIPSLVATCVELIGAHIDSVESFGELPPSTVDRIARIVSRTRRLSDEAFALFIEPAPRELALYDCASVSAASLARVGTACPSLERLRLDMCGAVDDVVINTWAKSMPCLRELTLYAAYRVTPSAWKSLYEALSGQLTAFSLRQSARFDSVAATALVATQPQLRHLQLSEIAKLTSEALPALHSLTQLESLDISRAGAPEGSALQDEAVTDLLAAIGGSLTELILDGNEELTDKTVKAVQTHCGKLQRLSIAELDQVSTASVKDLFASWAGRPVTHVSLRRCIGLEDEVIEELAKCVGPTLERVDLNSVDLLTADALRVLAAATPRLVELDAGFVRALTNTELEAFVQSCPALQLVHVHGDSYVTRGPSRRGVVVRGIENSRYAEYVV